MIRLFVLLGVLFAGAYYFTDGFEGVLNVRERSSLLSPVVREQMAINADYVDPRLMASDPSGVMGSNIYIQGKALKVMQQGEYTWVHVMAEVRDANTTESIIIELRPAERALLSDECYRFFGVTAGTTTVTYQFTGAEFDRPLLHGYDHTPSAKGKGGYGCAAP